MPPFALVEAPMRSTLVLAALLGVGLGCGSHVGGADELPLPAHTTLSPPPGPFNDQLPVTLTADAPATIFVTTDGTDPNASATRLSGASPFTVTLTQTTHLTYFSRTPNGANEPISSADYVRAGGKKGSISGVVVVGDVAVNQALALFADGQLTPLGMLAAPGTVPFEVDGLANG